MHKQDIGVIKMEDRITLISLFNTGDIMKIESCIGLNKKELCKVPYIDGICDRKLVDTLPYHFTFCAWDVEYEKFIIEKLRKIKFTSKEILIDGVDIMENKNGSYILYLNAVVDEKIKSYQENIYNILPVEKYDPKRINFHITIHVDKDYEKIKRIKEQIKFKPFRVKIEKVGLYRIYPAELIEKY